MSGHRRDFLLHGQAPGTSFSPAPFPFSSADPPSLSAFESTRTERKAALVNEELVKRIPRTKPQKKMILVGY